MRSFNGSAALFFIVWAIVGQAKTAAHSAPAVITPAPNNNVDHANWLRERLTPDPVSFVEVLLSILPYPLRQVAATNYPIASSILNSEFQNDQRPLWFYDLPRDIQSYLVSFFGPPASTVPLPSATSPALSALTTTAQSPSATATGILASISNGSLSSISISPTAVASTRSSFSLPTSSTASLRSLALAAPSTSPFADSTPNLSKSFILGLAIGIPLGVLVLIAVMVACCTMFRRRSRRKRDEDARQPSSGFIPRYAFQDHSIESLDTRQPLTHHMNHSTADLRSTAWEDGAYNLDASHLHDSVSTSKAYPVRDQSPLRHSMSTNTNTNTVADPAPAHFWPNASGAADPTSSMSSAIYCINKGTKSRAMRTSYTSLSSVPEVAEQDDPNSAIPFAPSSIRRSSRHRSYQSSLTPMGYSSSTLDRKVAASAASSVSHHAYTSTSSLPIHTSTSAPPFDHADSSFSGLALTTSTRSELRHPLDRKTSLGEDLSSPVSPITIASTVYDPFHYDAYVEDYDNDYQHNYLDIKDNTHGQDIEPSHGELSTKDTSTSNAQQSWWRTSKTEWPLRDGIKTDL